VRDLLGCIVNGPRDLEAVPSRLLQILPELVDHRVPALHGRSLRPSQRCDPLRCVGFVVRFEAIRPTPDRRLRDGGGRRVGLDASPCIVGGFPLLEELFAFSLPFFRHGLALLLEAGVFSLHRLRAGTGSRVHMLREGSEVFHRDVTLLPAALAQRRWRQG